MNLIDGIAIAQTVEAEVAKTIAQLVHRRPGLAFVLVGDNPASRSFIRMKKKKCEEVGIFSLDLELDKTTSEQRLLEEISLLNNNPSVDGILVQLPLPPHINTFKVMEAIDPRKDVDGFHPLNMGKLLLGETDGFFPCTPYGIATLLQRSAIPTEGKHVVIVGRSNIVGKPLAALLVQKNKAANATVTIAHSATKDLEEICLSADILVAAIGQPRFIRSSMVRKGAVVIDVGINRIKTENGFEIVGDVDFAAVAPLCSHITPVPKGVGPMTIAMLMVNTLHSYQKRER